jgi:hypothetical protein
MFRIMVLCVFTGLLSMNNPIVLDAQERTYDHDALRLDSRFGDLRILRGAEGAVVARIGVFRGGDVREIVEPSSNALAEARIFRRDYRPGNLVLGLGLMTFGVALGVSRIPDIGAATPAILFVTSTALIAYGGLKLQSAYNALHRALWWYNRDLKD